MDQDLRRLKGKSFEVRQAAGLLVKNNLRATFSSMPPTSQQYIKFELLPCIRATNKAVDPQLGQLSAYFFKLFKLLDGLSCFRLYINVWTIMIWIVWKVLWMLYTRYVRMFLKSVMLMLLVCLNDQLICSCRGCCSFPVSTCKS